MAEDRNPAAPVRDAIGLYARRKARMLFLRCHVPGDHPVLAAELLLIEMAKAKLLEALLSADGSFLSSPASRASTESAIKERMRQSTMNLVSDAYTRSLIFAEVDKEDIDSILIPRDRRETA